jgi:hypothetical protein
MQNPITSSLNSSHSYYSNTSPFFYTHYASADAHDTSRSRYHRSHNNLTNSNPVKVPHTDETNSTDNNGSDLYYSYWLSNHRHSRLYGRHASSSPLRVSSNYTSTNHDPTGAYSRNGFNQTAAYKVKT